VLDTVGTIVDKGHKEQMGAVVSFSLLVWYRSVFGLFKILVLPIAFLRYFLLASLHSRSLFFLWAFFGNSPVETDKKK